MQIYFALRLASKLADLQASYANPIPPKAESVRILTSLRHKIEKNTSKEVFFSMAERKGFEPLIPVRVYTISSRAP